MARPIVTLPGHTGYINRVLQLRDDTLVTASNDKTVRVWSIPEARCVRVLTCEDDPARDVAVVDGGTLLCVGGRVARLLRVCDGSVLAVSTPTEHNLVCCGVLSAHTGVLGDCRGTLYKVRWQNGIVHVTNTRHRAHGSTSSLQGIHTHGDTFATCSWDATARLWDAQSLTSLNAFRWQLRVVTAVAYDDAHLVTASHDRTLRVYNTHGAKRLRPITTHRGMLNSVCFLDPSRIISGGTDCTVAVHELPSGVCAARQHVGYSVSSIAALSGGKVAVATSGASCAILIFDVEELLNPPLPPPEPTPPPEPSLPAEQGKVEAEVVGLRDENSALRKQLAAAHQRIRILEAAVKRMRVAEVPNNQETCCVELEPFRRGDEVFRMPCLHVHHTACVLPYLRKLAVPECPVCRTTVPKSHLDSLPVWKWVPPASSTP